MSRIAALPNVQEIHRIRGVEFDLLIKVRLHSNVEEEKFISRIYEAGGIARDLRITVMETYQESLDIDVDREPLS